MVNDELGTAFFKKAILNKVLRQVVASIADNCDSTPVDCFTLVATRAYASVQGVIKAGDDVKDGVGGCLTATPLLWGCVSEC